MGGVGRVRSAIATEVGPRPRRAVEPSQALGIPRGTRRVHPGRTAAAQAAQVPGCCSSTSTRPRARSLASSAGPVEKQRREGVTRSYGRPSATPGARQTGAGATARIRWLTIQSRARRRRPSHRPVPQPAADGGTHRLHRSDRSASPAGKSAYPALRMGLYTGAKGPTDTLNHAPLRRLRWDPARIDVRPAPRETERRRRSPESNKPIVMRRPRRKCQLPAGMATRPAVVEPRRGPPRLAAP